jgi:hypothetical protein
MFKYLSRDARYLSSFAWQKCATSTGTGSSFLCTPVHSSLPGSNSCANVVLVQPVLVV